MNRQAKSHRYSGTSLTESYSIKQVATVVKILLPLSYAYAVMSSVCSSFVFPALYLVFFGGQTVDSTLYLILINFGYIDIAAYNLLSTLYILYHFEPLRRAAFHDIRNTTGIKIKEPLGVSPFVVNFDQEHKEHFDYLKASWA